MNSVQTELRAIAALPTASTSAGYPYLGPSAYRRLRDRVPHLFCMGNRCLEQIEELCTELAELGDDNGLRAMRVARQVVLTAAITAPTDLWLLRNLLGVLHRHGLSEKLLQGQALHPDDEPGIDAHQLRIAFDFLTARGLAEQYDTGIRVAGHPRVQAIYRLGRTPVPVSTTHAWVEALRDGTAPREILEPPALTGRTDPAQNHWLPTAAEVEIGHRLVPLVLALRVLGRTDRSRDELLPRLAADPAIEAAAVNILQAAGWVAQGRVTALGARGLRRGPGPFGIIETYHPYLRAADVLFRGGSAPSWVERGANVAASQDANRATFIRANDALDRFCADHHWQMQVFIEHAVGKGEATRIRYARDGDGLRYIGADLEDAAIDAAIAEQQAGRLPAQMQFVRHADIGQPDAITGALDALGLPSEGAVMMVGNGFHEVRGQTDESMVEVFRGYEAAGIILIFTEENALSSDDLRETAYNTYHAAFRYVHALSGQGLRPAMRRPPSRSGHLLPTAWTECATAAGYLSLPQYGYRSRTVFPAPNSDGHNPSISVTHFLLPKRIAAALGIQGAMESSPCASSSP